MKLSSYHSETWLKYGKGSTAAKPMIIVFTETWQNRVEDLVHEKHPGGNAITVIVAKNKFLKHPLKRKKLQA